MPGHRAAQGYALNQKSQAERRYWDESRAEYERGPADSENIGLGGMRAQ